MFCGFTDFYIRYHIELAHRFSKLSSVAILTVLSRFWDDHTDCRCLFFFLQYQGAWQNHNKGCSIKHLKQVHDYLNYILSLIMKSNYLQKGKTNFHVAFSHYNFSKKISKSSYFRIDNFDLWSSEFTKTKERLHSQSLMIKVNPKKV